MRVYLVRHGEARPKEEDPERGLTEGGRRDVEAVARQVAREALSVGSIWHSGKKRAAETARVLGDALALAGASVAVRTHSGLDPEDPVAPVAEEIRALEDDVAVVGHLPFLGTLTMRLLAVDSRKAASILMFPPAAVLCLERTVDTWLIAWFLTPSLAST
jgi:phosphohistidine phosphatase